MSFEDLFCCKFRTDQNPFHVFLINIDLTFVDPDCFVIIEHQTRTVQQISTQDNLNDSHYGRNTCEMT